MKPKSYYQKHGKKRVHVQVWEIANGPVPKGMLEVAAWIFRTRTALHGEFARFR